MSDPSSQGWRPQGSESSAPLGGAPAPIGPLSQGTAYSSSPTPAGGALPNFGGASASEPVHTRQVPDRQRAWIVIAATGLAGLLAGSVLGVTATDPTGSSEYQDLLSARQELELTNEDLEGELLDVEAERDDAIVDYEEAVAGADERAAALDEREFGLDQRSAELDQLGVDLDARSADLDARSAELDAREEAVSGLESYVEENSFGSGTLLVGEQVAAGTYSAPGGGNCYWERLSGTGGELGEIIANDWVPSSSQVIVTIRSSDVAFNSSDCGTWTVVP